MILTDLFNLDPDAIDWRPFRPGVQIHRLYGDGQSGPAAALLKYDPGARVPHHEHPAYEHILVLAGSQRDGRGTHAAGTLVVNPPRSRHDVVSDDGCVVLAIWEQPVVMLET